MKKCLMILNLFLMITTAAFSQEAANQEKDAKSSSDIVKLSLDEAVEYAIKNSRTLKSDEITLEMKKRAAGNAWNVFLPDVSITGTGMRATELSPSYAASGIEKYPNEESRWDVIGGLSAGWTFSAAYVAQIQIAKANYENGKINWEQSRKSTILNIKKLYYGLVLQQENLKIQKVTLENARQRYLQAQVNFKNGLVPEIALLQTQVNYENSKPNVESAEQSFYQNLDTLAFLIGMPVGTKLELTTAIEPVYVDVETQNLLDRFAKNDLDIQSMEKNIKIAKLGIKALDLSTWIPFISLNYGWKPMYVNGSSMGLPAGNAKAFGFMSDLGKDNKWYDSGSFTFTLGWNITNMLPWSSNRQTVSDAKQQLKQAELGLESLKENQKVQVRKAVDTLNLAKVQIDSMSKTVDVAQRAYDMQARSYRNGTTELLDLRDTESSLNSSKLGLLNQKLNYVNALLDLENTLNTKLVAADDNKKSE